MILNLLESPVDVTAVREVLLKQKDQLQKEFEEFQKQAEQLLQVVDKKIKIKIDTDLGMLPDLASEYSTISYTVGQYLADSKVHLQIFQHLFYLEKSQGLSEADRKLYTQTMTIQQNKLVSYLSNAADKLDKRITIIQSVMKAETARLVRGGMDGPDISNSQY